MKEALLVIDIDSGCGWGDNTSQYKKEICEIAQCIKHILDDAREKRELVVFVMIDTRLTIGIAQTSREHGTCIGCDPDLSHLALFLEHRHQKENFEAVFIKNSADAFAHPELAAFLRKHNVTGVRLAGSSTGLCVQFTAIGAIQKGFNVTLLEKGVYPKFRDENEKLAWITDVRHYDNQLGASLVTIE